MEFDSNKPIFLQIYDSICERILSGESPEGSRILSVRDLGAEIGVNPNTVMRSYERLTNDGIIFNKRGIGYFICEGAREKVLEKMREDFMQNELPGILKKIRLLGLSPEVLAGSCSKDTGE
ncbi:MAG: GntR family transcriptional regulator [Bacteroidetes bacterium]|jgi:DNA-binding transcriptional regulator YhcF (GntR family)|uniref:GntR family transcriptional regulator n=1 Tax=Candidatus Cryptobacteroides avicola TaxID=2840757 RepID=A0A940DVR4_9BACT|nr:GntR family transcriptional regulator [Candidatus Cryptobacteroides avicola]